jgi:glycosyltransferase involved in cell wall biosynthesis
VLDDGSGDHTRAVFEEFEGTPRLHLHRFEENRGANAARNFLIERILERGEPGFVSILDDDDVYLKDALARLADAAKRLPDQRWFVAESQDQGGRPLCRISPHGNLCFVRNHKLGDQMRGEVAHFIHTSIIEDSRFPSQFKNAEEWWFYSDVAKRSPIHALEFATTEMEYLDDGLTHSKPNRPRAAEIYGGKLERFDWALGPRDRAMLRCRRGRHLILGGHRAEGIAEIARGFRTWPLEPRVYQYTAELALRALFGRLQPAAAGRPRDQRHTS